MTLDWKLISPTERTHKDKSLHQSEKKFLIVRSETISLGRTRKEHATENRKKTSASLVREGEGKGVL